MGTEVPKPPKPSKKTPGKGAYVLLSERENSATKQRALVQSSVVPVPVTGALYNIHSPSTALSLPEPTITTTTTNVKGPSPQKKYAGPAYSSPAPNALPMPVFRGIPVSSPISGSAITVASNGTTDTLNTLEASKDLCRLLGLKIPG